LANDLSLYDELMSIRPSPVVALNRAIAIGQSEGPLRGLEELHAISNSERLASYPFHHAALGEFGHRDGKNDAAAEHFTAALALARILPNGTFSNSTFGPVSGRFTRDNQPFLKPECPWPVVEQSSVRCNAASAVTLGSIRRPVHCNIRRSTVLQRDDHNARPIHIRHNASTCNCFNVYFIITPYAYLDLRFESDRSNRELLWSQRKASRRQFLHPAAGRLNADFDRRHSVP